MKTGRYLFIVVFGLIINCACATKKSNNIRQAEWLIGTWENKTQNESIYETWRKANDNEFSAKSYIVKEQDTIIFETIQLVQEQNGLFYITTVKNQNDGLPVRFNLKTISGTALVFENPQHDFPQIISYLKINADSLIAEISGLKNGKKHKQTFPMKRVQ